MTNNSENTLSHLKTDVNRLHVSVRMHLKSAKEDAAEAGEKLIEAKKVLDHGEFKTWVEDNCSFSYRQAAKYMQVARAKSASRGTFDACTSIAEVLNMGSECEAAKPARAVGPVGKNADRLNDAQSQIEEAREDGLAGGRILGEALIEAQELHGGGYEKWKRTNLGEISKALEAAAILSVKEPVRFQGLRQAFPHRDVTELGELILMSDM